MARIRIPEGEDAERPEMSRLWDLKPELGPGFRKATRAVHRDSELPPREREAARIRIAQINDCGY